MSGSEGPGGGMGGGGRTRRTRLLACAAAIAAAALTGCGGGGGDGGVQRTSFVTPGPGQASLLLTADQAGSDLDLNTIRSDDGLALAPDGSLYVLRTDLFRVSAQRKVSRVWRADGYETRGLAVLPDGTVAVGVRGGVLRISAHGRASALAGAPERPKGSAGDGGSGKRTAAGPGADAFAGTVRPLGTRPDGALLVMDVDTLWAVKGGTVSRVADTSGAVLPGDDVSGPKEVRPTADADGDAYYLPGGGSPHGISGRVVRVTPDGKAARVRVPATVPGLDGGQGTLSLTSMAGDGADGLYVNAIEDGTAAGRDDYVLHLSDGKATVVAHSHSTEHGLDCTMRAPVSALALPCVLPDGMAYRAGGLVLDGMVHYMLELAVP